MHQSLARYSAPVSLVHAPSWADFITTMVGFKVFGTRRLTANHFSTVFWITVIPAFLSFILMLIAVKEPKLQEGLRRILMPFSGNELARLGATYWWVVAVAAVFTLARFSEAFLVLRAQSIGLPLMLVPIVLVIMNIAYAMSAYPLGALSDRIDRVTILILGLLLLLMADLFLAFVPGL